MTIENYSLPNLTSVLKMFVFECLFYGFTFFVFTSGQVCIGLLFTLCVKNVVLLLESFSAQSVLFVYKCLYKFFTGRYVTKQFFTYLTINFS